MRLKTTKYLKFYTLLLAIIIIIIYLGSVIPKKDMVSNAYHARTLKEIKSDSLIFITTTFDKNLIDSNNYITNANILKESRRISKTLGVEVRITFEDNYRIALQKLKSGQTDIIANFIPQTIDIDTTNIIFVKEQVSDPIYLVQRNDSANLIRNQLEIGGKTITLPKGSEYYLFIKNLSEYIGDSIGIEYDDLYNYEQLAIKVSEKKIDYTICRQSEKETLQKILPSINTTLPISYHMVGGWVIRSNCYDLKNILNNSN